MVALFKLGSEKYQRPECQNCVHFRLTFDTISLSFVLFGRVKGKSIDVVYYFRTVVVPLCFPCVLVEGLKLANMGKKIVAF